MFIPTASYTAIKTFERCRYAAGLQYVQKVKLPPPDLTKETPLTRGIMYHENIEQYLRRETNELLPMHMDTKHITSLMDKDIEIEAKWAFTQDFEEADYWDSPPLRVVADVTYIEDDTLHIIDWKTGSVKTLQHKDQANLYTLAGFARYPEVQKVACMWRYLDEPRDRTTYPVIKRDSPRLGSITAIWNTRLKKFWSCDYWKPSPSKNNCRYCNVNVKNHCEYKFVEQK